MAQVKIGWSTVNITPDKKISLAGQFAERISEYVEKPLTVTAMAVECGGDQMVMVSCDLVSITYTWMQQVRALLKDNKEGLDPEKVMACAIHTHTGYRPGGSGRTASYAREGFRSDREVLEQYLRPGQKYIEAADTKAPDIMTMEEGFKLSTEGVAQAALEAWKNREEASFANAFERACIGMGRRVDYTDNTAQMWGNANTAVFTEIEGGNDSGVELMYCFNKEDKLTGVVVNIACPAQCVQHRLFVSPDYWGEARKLIRERFGEDVYVLALCGPAGDQCPVDLVRWVNPDTDVHDPNLIRHNPPVRKADPSMFDLEGMRKAGKRVANAVRDAWEDGVGEHQSDIKFEHHVHNMQLPLRRATLTEYRNAVKAVKDFVRETDRDVDFNDLANLQQYLGIIRRFDLQERVETLDTEVHVIRMGSVVFATDPFELFLDYANQIKARQLCEQSFLVQLCCGSEGYLPTAKAEAHGHYSAFIPSGFTGHAGGDQLVRETLKDINQLFENDFKVYEYQE